MLGYEPSSIENAQLRNFDYYCNRLHFSGAL